LQQQLAGENIMNAFRLSINSNCADKASRVDKRVTLWSIRAVIKTTITLLIVVGFMNTAMNSSDIYFTLASMIWLWQGALEKIEF
jgi:hypothetical protein